MQLHWREVKPETSNDYCVSECPLFDGLLSLEVIMQPPGVNSLSVDRRFVPRMRGRTERRTWPKMAGHVEGFDNIRDAQKAAEEIFQQFVREFEYFLR